MFTVAFSCYVWGNLSCRNRELMQMWSLPSLTWFQRKEKCAERRQQEAVCGQKPADGGMGAALCARPRGGVMCAIIPFEGLMMNEKLS